MADKIYYFIMVPMVYFAVAVFVIGILVRVIRLAAAPRHPSTLAVFPKPKAGGPRVLYDTFLMPQVREHAPWFWVSLLLFHIAFLLLILGHLDLIPGVNIMPEDSIHMLGWGAVGVAVTLACFFFILRRTGSPIREISTPGDFLLLFLLLFLFLTGDTISWANSWNEDGFVLSKSDFGDYLQLLLDFSFASPRDVLYGSHYIVVVLHVLLANLLLIVFPFSKVMHTFFAMPLNRLRRG
ncbi:respiratory nitrate reductase subunit gamma [Candidatus Eisenbacteria bacterium]|uniref:Respiratory nitrate reductase subunit gamma n=1 Tax=Eiseniibacteriota bacterium TaxID=2212470 RepID=A0ABV6YJY6_UNCEI